MKKALILFLVFFGLEAGLAGDFANKNGNNLYSLREKTSWQEVWKHLPQKEKDNFQNDLQKIISQKDKMSEHELNKRLSALSDKYYHIYLKYVPKKRGVGEKIVNSAKEFFHMMIQFAKDQYKIFIGTVKHKMDEEKDPNYIPQYINGGRD